MNTLTPSRPLTSGSEVPDSGIDQSLSVKRLVLLSPSAPAPIANRTRTDTAAQEQPPVDTPEVPVKTADQVVELLSVSINQVRRGEIERRLQEIEAIVLKGSYGNVTPVRATA